MLCEKCKKNLAVVFYKENINGIKRSVALCEKCAAEAEYGHENGKQNHEFGNYIDHVNEINSIFGSLFGLPQYQKKSAADTKKCTLCGAVFAELVREGKAGCPECYKVFADELAPTISRIHGAAVHTGASPECFREGRERKAQIAALEGELKAAIEAEEYERAAELRDKLRALRDSNAEV